MEKSPSLSRGSIGVYAVQCEKCNKWRQIPNKEEFETIRHSLIENPWFCHRKQGISCDDPADLEFDDSRIWVIDKPNLPKPPPNTERILTMRRDLSKMDAQYIMPNGKRVRSSIEVQKFLDAHPEYKKTMSVSDFSFQTPKIMDETALKSLDCKGSPSSNKRIKTGKAREDQTM